MKENAKKILGYVFAALVVISLVLVIVGMFVGQLTMKIPNPVTGTSFKETANLFEEGWGEDLGGGISMPSNVFAIISFIVTIVGLVVLAADAVMRLFLKKDLKILRIVGAALAVVGAILVLVSGLLIVNKVWEPYLELGATKAQLKEAGMNIYCGAGVWLGFIGGLVGGVAGGLGLVKAFN